VDADPLTRFAEFSLPEGEGTVALARDFTREVLAGWGDRDTNGDVVLVVSELVTNAVRHGRCLPILRLSATAGGIRVEVTDTDPTPPRIRQPGADGGWGLRMVERLSSAWGVVPEGEGKVVWCEFRTQTDVPARTTTT
jgi:anti-sigma regulatory factor (Ser/Thr protein kinase)